jgi:tellurite resistance protein TehA-like permease
MQTATAFPTAQPHQAPVPYHTPAAPGGVPYPTQPPAQAWAPPRAKRLGPIGPLLMGAWQVLMICSGLAWTIDPTTDHTGVKPEDLPSTLATASIMLAANGLWAGALALRHWPHRQERRRAYFYLIYFGLAVLSCLSLLLVRHDLIF